ncbi:hypothetical protein EDD21DRAFT_37381 [Dissophora ornata]|nr:hypothetical protein EDD21DRAFT_37381 [Dissophora ornata]
MRSVTTGPHRRHTHCQARCISPTQLFHPLMMLTMVLNPRCTSQTWLRHWALALHVRHTPLLSLYELDRSTPVAAPMMTMLSRRNPRGIELLLCRENVPNIRNVKMLGVTTTVMTTRVSFMILDHLCDLHRLTRPKMLSSLMPERLCDLLCLIRLKMPRVMTARFSSLMADHLCSLLRSTRPKMPRVTTRFSSLICLSNLLCSTRSRSLHPGPHSRSPYLKTCMDNMHLEYQLDRITDS